MPCALWSHGSWPVGSVFEAPHTHSLTHSLTNSLTHPHAGALVPVVQVEALVHPFFDELRDPNTRLPNGKPLPPLFNFKKEVRPQRLVIDPFSNARLMCCLRSVEEISLCYSQFIAQQVHRLMVSPLPSLWLERTEM